MRNAFVYFSIKVNLVVGFGCNMMLPFASFVRVDVAWAWVGSLTYNVLRLKNSPVIIFWFNCLVYVIPIGNCNRLIVWGDSGCYTCYTCIYACWCINSWNNSRQQSSSMSWCCYRGEYKSHYPHDHGPAVVVGLLAAVRPTDAVGLFVVVGLLAFLALIFDLVVFSNKLLYKC